MRSIGSQPFLLTLHIKLCKRHMVASLQRSPHQESPSHCLCCRLRLGQLGRRCLQLLPNHRLLCQISSRKVHRSQIRLGWCGDSRPGWHHPDVPHPGLQCHAHECLGCHCYCWSAASSGLWARHFVVLGGFANLMLESDSTLMALYRYTQFVKRGGVFWHTRRGLPELECITAVCKNQCILTQVLCNSSSDVRTMLVMTGCS